jgi:hypothetical protein
VDGGDDGLAVLVVEGELGVEPVGVVGVGADAAGDFHPELPEAVDFGVEGVEDGVGGGVCECGLGDVGPDVHAAVRLHFDGAAAHRADVAVPVRLTVEQSGERGRGDDLRVHGVRVLEALVVGRLVGAELERVLEVHQARVG